MEINKTGKAPLFIKDGKLTSISAFDQNKGYLYNIYTPISLIEPIERFNINLDKLKRALSCISNDKPIVTIEVTDNALIYRDENLSANIKLIENSVVAVPKFNATTFTNFNFNAFKVNIPAAKITELRRGMDFASETSKFYISQEGRKIYFSFGDKQSSYNDDIKIFVSDNFTGTISENIYDISILKLTTKFNNDILLRVGDVGALTIRLDQPNSELNYITTQLKK